MNDNTGQQEEAECSVDFVQNYGQDNDRQPTDFASIEKLVKRYEELQSKIEEQFLIAGEDDGSVDYDLVEQMSLEIEMIAQKMETLPVTSLAIAKMKIEFFMTMIKSDHPDPVRVDIFKSKIVGVFANYTSVERMGKFNRKF